MRLHSWLSPKCHVGESPREGMGVFASEPLTARELVAVWGGVIYSADEVDGIANVFPHFKTHPVEVYEGFYMGSISNTAIDDAERFNHSCDPNIGVKGQIIVLARRDIAAGEELVFDYDTTDVAPAKFDCRCGATDCRGVVDGSGYRSAEFRRRHHGWLSWSISERVERLCL